MVYSCNVTFFEDISFLATLEIQGLSKVMYLCIMMEVKEKMSNETDLLLFPQ